MALLVLANEMRWCASNCLCRFLHRHVAALTVALLFIFCANQVLHYGFRNGNKGSPVCYQIVSPFAGSPALQQQLQNQGQPNLHHLYHEQLHRQLFQRNRHHQPDINSNNSFFNGTFPTYYNYVPPDIPWAQARLDNRRMVS